MNKRTSPRDAKNISFAEDIDEVVQDKRAGWRANPAKARRRQRRYKKLITTEFLMTQRQTIIENVELKSLVVLRKFVKYLSLR